MVVQSQPYLRMDAPFTYCKPCRGIGYHRRSKICRRPLSSCSYNAPDQLPVFAAYRSGIECRVSQMQIRRRLLAHVPSTCSASHRSPWGRRCFLVDHRRTLRISRSFNPRTREESYRRAPSLCLQSCKPSRFFVLHRRHHVWLRALTGAWRCACLAPNGPALSIVPSHTRDSLESPSRCPMLKRKRQNQV